ncbi:MAG: superoxide dismutase [Chloroflexi bacterium AL-W]|nr:superoxide dismutase [Chloroflexi bacterium AL-N1]NOK66144.1 superoxide dismutase [Chloroflexi bacterium AL-N10]NOK73025.1 superoxide dismutase [Chloroflexi bacterium AL-N5]NOK79922.1 superoxide dismutase [Chloroflexi bacterium AL-W]NOK88222.1 superoxide dismutase [Chloroflexi bacterium AL-N15]
MTFTLSSLPFDFAALEPHIDAQTMQIHHGKHHAAYVNNLNAALEGHANLQNQTIEDILRNINDVPEGIRMAVRNNGGGHANHTLFWSIMGPNGGGEPTGALAQAINSTFGDFNTFKQQMVDAGVKRFGSGWSWLIKDASGKLQVLSSANQDSPYMDGNTPIMGIDVWEHAYYLKYQNRRPDYLSAWWNTVNWHAVAANFEK